MCSLCCDAACRLFPAAEADTGAGTDTEVCGSFNFSPLSVIDPRPADYIAMYIVQCFALSLLLFCTPSLSVVFLFTE